MNKRWWATLALALAATAAQAQGEDANRAVQAERLRPGETIRLDGAIRMAPK